MESRLIPHKLNRRRFLALGLASLGATGALAAPGAGLDKVPLASVGFDIDPRMGDVLAGISTENLRHDIAALSGFPTRWTQSPDFRAVEDWMASAMGAATAQGQAVLQPYLTPSGQTRHNILSHQPDLSRPIILVGAHFDSTSEQPARLAPGANDNASGVAAMLEAARRLGGLTLQSQVVFIAFSGEEQGFWGSTAAAAAARAEGWSVDLMINLDMLGRRVPIPSTPLFVEYDQGNAVHANNAAARDFGVMAAGLASELTALETTHTDIWGSDYMPFEAEGYPCIGFYDGGADTAEYHSTQDTIGQIDFDRLTEVTHLLVASILTVAAGAGPTRAQAQD